MNKLSSINFSSAYSACSKTSSEWGRHCLRIVSDLSFTSDLLSMVRGILKAVAYSYKDNPSKADVVERLEVAALSLKTVSVLVNFARVPGKVSSMYRVTIKLINDSHEIVDEIRYKGTVPKRKILKNVTRIFYLIESSASLADKMLYSPVKLTDMFFDLGSFSDSMAQQWKVICIVKRGSKICVLVGKILQGKKVGKRSFELIVFQLPGLTLDILAVANVQVHPAVKLSFQTAKSIYDLVDAWESTQ